MHIPGISEVIASKATCSNAVGGTEIHRFPEPRRFKVVDAWFDFETGDHYRCTDEAGRVWSVSEFDLAAPVVMA